MACHKVERIFIPIVGFVAADLEGKSVEVSLRYDVEYTTNRVSTVDSRAASSQAVCTFDHNLRTKIGEVGIERSTTVQKSQGSASTQAAEVSALNTSRTSGGSQNISYRLHAVVECRVT